MRYFHREHEHRAESDLQQMDEHFTNAPKFQTAGDNTKTAGHHSFPAERVFSAREILPTQLTLGESRTDIGNSIASKQRT